MATKTNSREAIRIAQLRQVWQERAPKEPGLLDLMSFHAWLLEHRPDLVPRVKHDSYQQLKVDLSGLLDPKFHL
jgi:hypothetical protein